jgi:creatinine amidohydrolase
MQLTDLTWTQAQALPREIPVVFPVAALEQHGHHLPVFTDSFLLGEIARRAEAKLGNRALFAPLQWLGNSEHHLDFAGTMSATPRAYLDLLNGMLENFIHHGFRRLVFINGHGGNDVPGRQVIFEARQRHRHRSDLLLLFATYWQLGATPPLAAAALQQEQMGHACEWETSMMLRIAPHLVRDFKLAKPVSAGNLFEPVARGWTTKDRSAPGHIGAPHLATAEKGEALLSFFSAEVVQLIERVVAWNGKDW